MAVKLTDASSVKDVMKELTLQEKAELVSGGGIYHSKSIERLGIPSALFIDAGCGINIRQYLEALYNLGILEKKQQRKADGTEGIGDMARFGNLAENITSRENLKREDNELLDVFLCYVESLLSVREYPSCFPSNSLLAATWNPEAVYRDACAVGQEASAYGVDVLLGTPCINIQRDPRGGRGFESYSEDPYLTAVLGACFVRGIQDQGITANVKHFAANNQETERMRIDEIIPERALYEIYLPAFKACVTEGGAKSLMSAYNWINGYPCAQNSWLLRKVLRDEWDYEGFVVSDWRAAYDHAASVKAGNDLAMPGPRDPEEIVQAVKKGSLRQEELDEAVEHFLKVLVDMPVMRGRSHTSVDFQASARSAYETAAEGITLLKNRGEVLPLSENTHVAFFGDKSDKMIESGIGSGHVFTDKTSSLVECVQRIVGDENIAQGEIREDTQAVVVTVATEGQEGGDCPDIRLKREDLQMLSGVIHEARERSLKVILILNVAGPVEMMDFIDGIDACLDVYYPGQEGARAAADILFGRVNPSGKLPHTFPRYYRDCPSYGNFPGYNEKVVYGEGIYVGYRWYDTRKITPLFPFGFGLSYTDFEIGDLRLNREILNVDREERIEVKVRVTNTGRRKGKEVVQLYVRDVASTLDKPEKELKGFRKVELEPGESRYVVFSIGREELSSFDTRLHAWVCEPGEFEVLVGNSSGGTAVRAGFRVEGKNPYGYGPETPIIKLSMDRRAVEVIMGDIGPGISEKQFYNAAYFGQRHTLQVVWETMLSGYVKGTVEEKERVYQKILEDLRLIDVSEANLVERFVF